MGLDIKVSDDSSVVATKEQVSSDLAGEAVILNIKSGVYYGLNAVGARIWNLIQEQKTVKEVRDTILAEYDVEPEQCDRELLEILKQLESEGLIEVKNETAA
ncbi:MAG TPA: lasso peptide biosynthesis PqqD family chaperone [Candidatus Obscuribacterales bacterium]